MNHPQEECPNKEPHECNNNGCNCHNNGKCCHMVMITIGKHGDEKCQHGKKYPDCTNIYCKNHKCTGNGACGVCKPNVFGGAGGSGNAQGETMEERFDDKFSHKMSREKDYFVAKKNEQGKFEYFYSDEIKSFILSELSRFRDEIREKKTYFREAIPYVAVSDIDAVSEAWGLPK